MLVKLCTCFCKFPRSYYISSFKKNFFHIFCNTQRACNLIRYALPCEVQNLHLTAARFFDRKYTQSYVRRKPPRLIAWVAFVFEGVYGGMRLLMIDNYDSFTYNLVQLFYEFDLEVLVFRHDCITLDQIAALRPNWLCISPGPRDPAHAGISKAAVAYFAGQVPILGVCLGMQVFNEVFGGVTRRAPLPMHGKCSYVTHNGRGLFAGIPSPFRAARYHSLCVEVRSPELIVTARAEDGVVMAIEHRSWPLYGVQCHPESFLTEHGRQLAANFLQIGLKRGKGGNVHDTR